MPKGYGYEAWMKTRDMDATQHGTRYLFKIEHTRTTRIHL